MTELEALTLLAAGKGLAQRLSQDTPLARVLAGPFASANTSPTPKLWLSVAEQHALEGFAQVWAALLYTYGSGSEGGGGRMGQGEGNSQGQGQEKAKARLGELAHQAGLSAREVAALWQRLQQG